MKSAWRDRNIALLILRDGDMWSASCLVCFTPVERSLCTQWLRGWVSSRAKLGALEKREILHPCQELQRDSLYVYLVAYYHNNCCTSSCLCGSLLLENTRLSLKEVLLYKPAQYGSYTESTSGFEFGCDN